MNLKRSNDNLEKQVEIIKGEKETLLDYVEELQTKH